MNKTIRSAGREVIYKVYGRCLAEHEAQIILSDLNNIYEITADMTGLDPGRPLVSDYGSRLFRLGRDDAYVVQVVHTNAGFLGETGLVGHADFCVNGGTNQPGCKGHTMRKARCSHFMSSCYFAASIRKSKRLIGIPCDNACPKVKDHWGIRFDRRAVVLGDDMPDRSSGMYCVSFDHNEDCPFD